MAELEGKLSAIPSLSGSLSQGCGMVGSIEHVAGREYYPYYNGRHRVVPTRQEQVLPTAATIVTENIVVAPIPNNYGLITWNGSYITVS